MLRGKMFPPPLVRRFLLRYRLTILAVSVLMLLQVALLVLMPLPLRSALDRLTGTLSTPIPYSLSKPEFLGVLAFLTLAMGLATAALEYLEGRWTSRLAAKIIADLRLDLLGEVLTRRLSYLESRRKVDLLGRVSGDVQNLELYFTSLISIAVRSVPSLLFVIAAMLWMQPWFAFVLVTLLAGVFAAATGLSRQIRRSEKTFRQATTRLEHEIMQSLNAMPLIKSLQGEGRTRQIFGERQRSATQAFNRSKNLTALLDSLFSSGRHVIRAVVILLGGWAILHGQMTLGSLFAFVSYLELLGKPVLEIANYFSRSTKAAASLERIEELEAELAPMVEVSGALTLSFDALQLAPQLDFVSTRFAYEGGGEILSACELELGHGRLIALVGESGAGKSSLLRLGNRLMDPTSGVVRLGGVDLRELQLETVRRLVCVVSQEPFLLSASLRENLSWARQEPLADEDLWLALRQAALEPLVRAMPLGLDTLIGDGGMQLSGGEAKRVSLARGFLRAQVAQLLLFDEPTSGLDPLSAQTVMRSLASLAESKFLVLFSTHRMSEILLADDVLFLAKAQTPRLGSHRELQETSAAYRDLAQELEPEAEPT